MNINNEYIKVYLESLNNKKLINESQYINQEVDCKIKLFTRISGQDNTGTPNDLSFFPNLLFSNNEFTVKELSGKHAQLIKGKISGMIHTAYKSALSQNNRNSKLLRNKKYYCLICFFVISQNNKNGITQYILTTNEMKKIYLVIPDNKNMFETAKTDLRVLTSLHDKDELLQVFSFSATLPLNILSVVWEMRKRHC